MKEELASTMLDSGYMLSKLFPLKTELIAKLKKAEAPQSPVPMDIIKIAESQFTVTICKKSISHTFEKFVDQRISWLKGIQKSVVNGFAGVIPQDVRRQGVSISIVIANLVQLVRNLMKQNEKNTSEQISQMLNKALN